VCVCVQIVMMQDHVTILKYEIDLYMGMGWLWLVGSIKLYVSVAKEPSFNILRMRPIV